MSKYIFLFRGRRVQEMSPDERQASMMKWKSWMDGLAAKKHVIGGEPLDNDGKVVKGRAKSVTDGPFAEGKEIVGGYLVVDAGSLDAATELSKGCPILDEDGSVEVRTVAEMNM